MADFDCIVVGAGVSGSAAAYKMAANGVNVLLVDRSKPIGSKNLSGGVLWGHDLAEIIPDWYKEAPVERPITMKGVNFLTKESGFSAQFSTEEWKKAPHNGFSVLRARFDEWLAGKVGEVGGMVVDGVNVEHLKRNEAGKVIGVEQGGETITADCVLLADGCNSRLSMDLGVRGKLDRRHYVLGVKEVIELSEETIQERFNIGPGEGVAHEYVLGYLENGAKAGGFLYTNKDTISLGIVVNLDSIWEKGVWTHKIMEDFRLHPSVAPLLKGGKMVEYGAHLIPEGGLNIVPQLAGDGWLISGDAAGLVYSNGLVIHGMNYAIRSGLLAADTVIEAKKKGDYSHATLSAYSRRIENSYILKDFEKFKHMHEFIWDDNMHGPVPSLVEGVMKELFTADMQPKDLVRDVVKNQLKEKNIGKWSLAKTLMKGGRSI